VPALAQRAAHGGRRVAVVWSRSAVAPQRLDPPVRDPSIDPAPAPWSGRATASARRPRSRSAPAGRARGTRASCRGRGRRDEHVASGQRELDRAHLVPKSEPCPRARKSAVSSGASPAGKVARFDPVAQASRARRERGPRARRSPSAGRPPPRTEAPSPAVGLARAALSRQGADRPGALAPRAVALQVRHPFGSLGSTGHLRKAALPLRATSAGRTRRARRPRRGPARGADPAPPSRSPTTEDHEPPGPDVAARQRVEGLRGHRREPW
jgi:hypothetical protein